MDTVATLQREQETLHYFEQVKQDLESELAARVASSKKLQARLEDLISNERKLSAQIAFSKVERDSELERIE